MTTWHDDANARKRIGDAAEKEFAARVRCHCGGRFDFIGDLQAGYPDFTCQSCGQLADVKAATETAERTGNLAVSSVPWSHYPEDMLLATRINGQWLANYKRFIAPANDRPLAPTHNSRNTALGNTRFYLVPWAQLVPIGQLGLSEND